MSMHSFQMRLVKALANGDRVLWGETEDGKIVLADGVVAMVIPRDMVELDLGKCKQYDLSFWLRNFNNSQLATKGAHGEAYTGNKHVPATRFDAAESSWAWVQDRFLKEFPSSSEAFISPGLSPVYIVYKDELRGWIMPVRKWKEGD